MRRIYSYLILTLIVLISTFVLWKSVGFLTTYKQFDGPWYVIVAKTFYNQQAIKKLHVETESPSIYFAAHYPLYPALIRLMSEISPIGELKYLKSMLLVNLFSTIGLVLFFYYLLKKFKLTESPLALSIILLFLPRFLVVRSAGAPESLFLLLILLSLFFFEKGKFWLAGLFGGLATMTKSPGILLFVGYILVFAEKFVKSSFAKASADEGKINWNSIGIILIPTGLLAVFTLYWTQYGDFFAYFHSGDNIHLVYPFAVFNFQQKWVGTAWLEEIIFYFFMYGLVILNLKDSKYRSFFYFGLVFFIAVLFVEHRDISRYSLPLWPLALIALEKFFTSKKFLTIFIILLPAIFLYAYNFLLFNIMPISDWKAFL